MCEINFVTNKSKIKNYLFEYIVDNKVNGLGVAAFDTFLNHMIAILVLDTFDNIALELFGHFNLFFNLFFNK